MAGQHTAQHGQLDVRQPESTQLEQIEVRRAYVRGRVILLNRLIEQKRVKFDPVRFNQCGFKRFTSKVLS